MSQSKLVKIAVNLRELNFNSKGLALLNIEDKSICIIRHGNQIFACSNTCPHAGAKLSEHGFVNNQSQIVCCVHNYRFSLLNGRDAFNEGYLLKIYPVSIKADGVYIEINPKAL